LVEEDPVDWLPDTWMQFLEQKPEVAGQPQMPGQGIGALPPGQMPPPGMGGVGGPNPQGTPAGQGIAPQAPTAVPQGEVSGGTPNMGGLGKIFERKM
jgi:hypothetical protein